MKTDFSGLRAWMIQRLTALYLAVFTLWFGARLLVAPPADHAAWAAFMAEPSTRTMVTLFFLALMAHAWVGVRDILIDYVKPVGLRFALLVTVGFAIAWQLVWLMDILYGGGA